MTKGDFDFTHCHCCGRWVPWVEGTHRVVVRRLDEGSGSYFNMLVEICKACEEDLKSEAPPSEL